MKTIRHNGQNLRFRNASRDELDLAVAWAAAEGWNPGLHDADIFWHTDPEGFVCIERDHDIIGVGSIVSYGTFGFMGFFITRKDLRQQGIGRPFWYWRRDTLQQRLAPNAAIGMDGVIDMQMFYAKGGFEYSHNSNRMAFIGKASAQSEAVVPLDQLPYSSIAAMDKQCFGVDRDRFLTAWTQPKQGLALATVNEHKQLTGFGVIRACQEGFKIGPLFCNHVENACHLVSAFSHYAKGENIYLDIPEVNPHASRLIQQFDMEKVFACGRMYYGIAPTLPWHKIFGLTSFELG